MTPPRLNTIIRCHSLAVVGHAAVVVGGVRMLGVSKVEIVLDHNDDPVRCIITCIPQKVDIEPLRGDGDAGRIIEKGPNE
jgi:hypothetical protein